MISVSLRNSAGSADVIIRGVTGLPDEDVPFNLFGFSAQPCETLALPTTGEGPAMTIWVGLGSEPDAETLRRAAAAAVDKAKKAKTVAVDFATDEPEALAAITEGVLLGSYSFTTYRTNSPEASLTKAWIITQAAQRKAARKAVEEAQTVARATCLARDWVNTPPLDLRPADFATQIEQNASASVRVKIWDEKRLAKENCGGVLAVGRGSSAPPRIVKLSYTPEGATKHLALVGKGITFDSGGLSIKPGASMQTMKCDMGGAAAVVTATYAIAELGLPIAVSAWACLAENMPSGDATRPGDVVTMRSGATVEIHNTDAEGRLVLADGLALAVEAEPDHIIDVATLTGAAMVALGTRTTAVLGTDPILEGAVLDAATATGESMWSLPLTEELLEAVTSSNIADVRQHNPKPYGGTIYAAAFLRQFVKESSWAHLDIAGPAFNDGSAWGYTPAGGTGASVRTLVQLARDLSQ